MKHLKLFTTETAFEAAKSNIEKPWVALTKDDNEVHYAQGEPQPTYEMVDLGLPSGLKWATCNIGASKPEEYGDYFMWGSVTPNTEEECDWAHAPFNNGASSYDPSYFASVKDTVCPNDVLASKYDAATQKWGAGYRMPTEADFDELLANTINERINNYNSSGVQGYKFTSKTDPTKSIFIPASGYRSSSTFFRQNSDGCVWSSSLDSEDPYCCRNLWLEYYSGLHGMASEYRYIGFCVRPVSAK